MSDRAGPRLAWGLFSMITIMFAAAIWLEIVNGPPPDLPEWDSTTNYLFNAVVFSFPLVGAFVAARQHRNALGWVMLGIGLVAGATGLMDGYARYALQTEPGSLPRPDLALALTAGSWVFLIVPIGAFLLLLFPDGRLPSKRWRPALLLAAVAMLATYTVITLFPGTFSESGYPKIRNPLGLESFRPWEGRLLFVLALVPVSILVSAGAVVARFRSSRGQARLQMKWLAAAAAIVAVAYGFAMAVTLAAGLTDRAVPPGWVVVVQQIVPLSFGLIPLAMGVAILRHRLYDVDVIINKTLVYALLTAALALMYLLGVTAFQTLLSALAGKSDLAVAASTLAVAALFRPIRAGVQSFIDRRFYRRKYDAEQTLEIFSSRLRDEIDLTTLSQALTRVVSRTMQPAHVSVWLRDTRREPLEDGA